MNVFFYGLFMDVDILANNDVYPTRQDIGYLQDYTLKIGNRASLIPSKNKRAYGILMTVDSDKMQDLYAEPSVADYIPEEATIVLNTGKTVAGICYNLPAELLTGTNTNYAKSLYKLAKKMGLPIDYQQTIKRYISE